MRWFSGVSADSPRPEALAGAGVAAGFFGVFLGWAALAPLDAGVLAPGQVTVSGSRQAVQHRDGGVVEALHVAEGDMVSRGQVLIELNAGELRASERAVTGQVFALLAQRARLIAERDRLGALPVPAEFADLPPQDRTLADEALRLQRRQFSARGSGRATTAGVLVQRIGQLEDQMEGYRRQTEAVVEQRRLIEDELEGLRRLAAQGYAPLVRVRALERSAAALDGERGALQARLAAAREQVGEVRLQIAGVDTGLQEDVAEQLRQVETQLSTLQPQMADLRDRLARARIRSPASGAVVGLRAFTPGGVIAPGETVLEVVPADRVQVVVAQVDPADVDGLRPGLVTEVRLPDLGGRPAPVLRGRVSRVSADTFEDERRGRAYYRVEVRIDPAELARTGSAADGVRAGLPVQVRILKRPRTALQYLVEPLGRSLWRTAG